MPMVTLYLNDDAEREFRKVRTLKVVPRLGELVMTKGYGYALTVEAIHHHVDDVPPKISVFFQKVTTKDFDAIIAADSTWRES